MNGLGPGSGPGWTGLGPGSEPRKTAGGPGWTGWTGFYQKLTCAGVRTQETKTARNGDFTRSTRSIGALGALDLRIPWTGFGAASPVHHLSLTITEIHMTDEDRERLARSADERIKDRIEAARRRAELQRQGRDEFAASRTAGLRSRHAAKQARNRLAQRHGRRGA